MSYDVFHSLRQSMNQQILGQDEFVVWLLCSLLSDGHILVEGPPGLAKTRAVKALSSMIEADFQRIQFTPDLLPADLTGMDIYRPENGTFEFQSGPVFHHLLLADEINRAPAKVQAALLEAMGERQVTVGQKTYPLPELFLVMATQNPIEQEGTYSLPEAQLDRFMLHLDLSYPDFDTELKIMNLLDQEFKSSDKAAQILLSQAALFEARKEVLNVHVEQSLEHYIVNIICATRMPEKLDADLAKYIEFGVSSRATAALLRCAKSLAWLDGRDYVKPDDIQRSAYPVLRHRLLLSYVAESEGLGRNDVIAKILSLVAL